MKPLSPQEKRTVRIAGIGLAIYLVVFGGVVVLKRLEKRRTAYAAQVAEAQGMRHKVQIYRDKAELIGELMERFHLDPMTLARTSVVAQASAALQKAALAAGVAPGTIRETTSRGTAKELAAIQLEGAGNVAGLMSFLHHLPTLGYPLILDTLQITSDGRAPMIKFNLTIAVVDFEQWSESQSQTQTQEEQPRA